MAVALDAVLGQFVAQCTSVVVPQGWTREVCEGSVYYVR